MKTPRPYQTDAILRMAHDNYILADDCGLGKTYTTIQAVLMGRAEPISPFWSALIICPLRIRDQWVQELQECDPNTPVTTFEYGLPMSFQLNRKPVFGWYVTYYENVVPMEHDLISRVWDVVICDEAHRLKNRNTLWTESIKRITAARKYGLTGTLIEKGPQDVWSLFNWTHPEIAVFHSYWKFVQAYVDYEITWQGYYKLKGAKNQDRLARLLRTMLIKRTKQEVEPELPPRVHQIVRLHMGPTQAHMYQQIEESDDIIVTVDDQTLLITNVLALIVRLQQVASFPPLLGLDSPSVKVDWVKGWIDDNPNEQVVIFTKFRALAEHLHEQLDSDIIVGGVRTPPRAWLAGDKQCMIGTIAAMSEGIDGLQRSNYAIFVDQDWSTIHMSQAYDRIHRMGIDHTKFIYTLICAHTKDELVNRSLDEKWDTAKLVYEALNELKDQANTRRHG